VVYTYNASYQDGGGKDEEDYSLMPSRAKKIKITKHTIKYTPPQKKTGS
jgi:hypothetical protein